MAPTAVIDTTPPTPAAAQNAIQAQKVPNLFALNGKTIAITGGGRGLGMSLAFAVIEAGGHVACLDILPAPSEKEWSRLLKLASASNLTASYHQCDVTSEVETTNTLETIAQEATARRAPFSGIVACAGIQQQVPALEYDAQDFERILRVNVTGSFLTAKRAARIFVDQKQDGSIVLIASMSGQIANRVGSALQPILLIEDNLTQDRASHALHTTLASLLFIKCAVQLRKNGGNMEFESTHCLQA